MGLTLKFDLLFKNFNLSNNFLTRSIRAFILHMCITCDKTFHMMPIIFDLVTLTLRFDLLLKNFNLCCYLMIVAARRASLSSDNSYCIYIHAVTSSFVLLLNVCPISVTCQFVICFVPFSYVAFLFYPLLYVLRFSYGETTSFTMRLVHSAYDVKGRNSYATLTNFVDLRDLRVMLWVIFSLQER